MAGVMRALLVFAVSSALLSASPSLFYTDWDDVNHVVL